MSIEVLGICGSPIQDGNTEAFLKEALQAAESVGQVQVNFISLAGREIQDCSHCNWCVRKQSDGKFCAKQDGMMDIYPLMLKADALLLASPVYIGRLSGYLACFSDRLRVFAHGNVYKGKLTDKIGGALAVSWYRNRGPEMTLLGIVSTFLTFGMIPVGPTEGLGSPFGAAGLATDGGTGKFNPEDRLGVLSDEYGVMGARLLGERVAEITRRLKRN